LILRLYCTRPQSEFLCGALGEIILHAQNNAKAQSLPVGSID